MGKQYICINKCKKSSIGEVVEVYKEDFNLKGMYSVKTGSYIYSIYSIPKDILNKNFLVFDNTYKIKFKTKNKLGFNKTINYNISFKNIEKEHLILIYKKIFSYIKKIEVIDKLILNSFQNVIMDVCNNLMEIESLEENFENNFELFIKSVNEAEKVFKSMYKTALSIEEEVDLTKNTTKKLLENNKIVIDIYNQMFKELNNI